MKRRKYNQTESNFQISYGKESLNTTLASDVNEMASLLTPRVRDIQTLFKPYELSKNEKKEMKKETNTSKLVKKVMNDKSRINDDELESQS